MKKLKELDLNTLIKKEKIKEEIFNAMLLLIQLESIILFIIILLNAYKNNPSLESIIGVLLGGILFFIIVFGITNEIKKLTMINEEMFVVVNEGRVTSKEYKAVRRYYVGVTISVNVNGKIIEFSEGILNKYEVDEEVYVVWINNANYFFSKKSYYLGDLAKKALNQTIKI